MDEERSCTGTRAVISCVNIRYIWEGSARVDAIGPDVQHENVANLLWKISLCDQAPSLIVLSYSFLVVQFAAVYDLGNWWQGKMLPMT